MNKETRNSENTPKLIKDMSAKLLARALFKAELTDEEVRSLPAQNLFTAIKLLDHENAIEVLNVARIEQCRLVIDFDCWSKDELSEDNLWEWIKIGSSENELKFLQKFLKFCDLKLVTLLIGKYVEHVVFTEPTEKPPEGGFFTPDQGYTWIRIKLEEEDKHFAFSRLLALIFETSAELFYQLIQMPSVSTKTVLMEESYQEKTKRLLAEGIPDPEWAYEINSKINFEHLKTDLNKDIEALKTKDYYSLKSLIYQSMFQNRLYNLITEAKFREEIEMELGLLMNAGIVHFGIDFHETNSVFELTEKVKGAIEIGFEVLEKEKYDYKNAYIKLGLQKVYRLGLTEILKLKAQFKKNKDKQEDPQVLLELESALSIPFPYFPSKLFEGSANEEIEPFSSLEQVERVLGVLS